MWPEWIKTAIEELPSGDSFNPKTELSPEDEFVGFIDDLNLRGLYRLFVYYDQLIEEMQIAYDPMLVSEAEHEERKQDYQFLLTRYDEINELFLRTVEQEFPVLKGKPWCTICKGWLVAWSPAESAEDEVEEYESLFGLVGFPEGVFESLYPPRPSESGIEFNRKRAGLTDPKNWSN